MIGLRGTVTRAGSFDLVPQRFPRVRASCAPVGCGSDCMAVGLSAHGAAKRTITFLCGVVVQRLGRTVAMPLRPQPSATRRRSA